MHVFFNILAQIAVLEDLFALITVNFCSPHIFFQRQTGLDQNVQHIVF